MNTIGIDIGGTKIKAGKVSKERIEKLLIVNTKSNASQNEVILQIASLIDKLIDKNTKNIGIAVPAIVDITNGIVFETINIPSWKKVPIKKILEIKYKIPVFINNDANCFALGEKCFGAGKNHSTIAALTIGTGLGAGIIINGKLYSGYNCGAGEFGEVVFKKHNFEYYCSGKYFLKEYSMKGEDLYKKAKQNNKKALSIYNEFGNNLGKLLAMIVHAIDPEIIILGGSVSRSYRFFEKPMKKSLKELIYARSFSRLKIKLSKSDNIIIKGAASLHRDPPIRIY
jgi:glucokinase